MREEYAGAGVMDDLSQRSSGICAALLCVTRWDLIGGHLLTVSLPCLYLLSVHSTLTSSARLQYGSISSPQT